MDALVSIGALAYAGACYAGLTAQIVVAVIGAKIRDWLNR